ncbi:MAG: AmmeMemoRadiSam system protein A [Thioalkalispiraceae bacterium]|jgi:AmmeMemoRadiSam system protein A
MFSDAQKACLLETARASIEQGLKSGQPLKVNPDEFEAALREQRACFVTLQIEQQLRGCIGTLEAYRPLIEDVAENAFAAAFRDPRFPPLSDSEFELLHYHISVLSKPEPVSFDSEADLLSKIRPGIDGLVLEDKGLRGTFLPSVWESLPEPQQFLQHLKQKAGLPAHYWSDTLQVERYTAESIE